MDFSTTVGQDIVAPFDGKVKNMKGASKPYYPIVQMFPANPSSSFDRLEILYVKRLKEAERNVFRNVKAGDIIGAAANLQKWYSSTVGPHVHVQIFKDGVRIDPQPFFFKK